MTDRSTRVVTVVNRMCFPPVLLLDMDGTILTSTHSGSEMWRTACDIVTRRLHSVEPEEVSQAIEIAGTWRWGDHYQRSRRRNDLKAASTETAQPALDSLGPDALAQEITTTYAALREADIHPFPSALETLQILRERGVRLALLTNGSARTQRAKIERHALATYFDCILIEGEFGVGKPDERVYRHALTRLGVAPADTWMVGDDLECDVAGPQRLGIRGIWVDFQGVGLPPGSTVQPDGIIRTLADLLQPGQQVSLPAPRHTERTS